MVSAVTFIINDIYIYGIKGEGSGRERGEVREKNVIFGAMQPGIGDAERNRVTAKCILGVDCFQVFACV